MPPTPLRTASTPSTKSSTPAKVAPPLAQKRRPSDIEERGAPDGVVCAMGASFAEFFDVSASLSLRHSPDHPGRSVRVRPGAGGAGPVVRGAGRTGPGRTEGRSYGPRSYAGTARPSRP